jgi:hypothetical protein
MRKSFFAADFAGCGTVEKLDKLAGRWQMDIGEAAAICLID